MKNWIKNHYWQIITTVLSIIAVVVAYDIFFRSKPIKELRVITSLPLSVVDVNPEAAKDIQVLYKGKPVNNISLFQIQITNTGNQSILETEYSKPLSFSFTPNNEILDAAIISSNPSSIGMEIINKSQNNIEMSKALLNPQDVVSVRFVIKGSTGDTLLKEFNASGRIAGVKDISVQSSIEQESTSPYLVLLSVIAGVLIGAITNLVSYGIDKVIKRFRKRKQSPENKEDKPPDELT